MRTGSLLGILLDLLADLSAPGPLPADARVGRFFRARRYLGARDRRLLGGLAYGFLRHRLQGVARWDAFARRVGLPLAGEFDGRESPVPALLALAHGGLLAWTAQELAAAARQLLEPGRWDSLLSRAEPAGAFGPADWPADPEERLAAELSLPLWLARRLAGERGVEELRRLGALLLEEAPCDLRVNLARLSREEAREALRRELGVAAEPTAWSPLGLRLSRRRNLGRFLSLHPGCIEVQDEGSQLVALCAEPEPGGQVVDACAGAGGKTLALLDLLEAEAVGAVVHACDVLPEKLAELERRAEGRGGRVVVHPIAPAGPLPAAVPERAHLLLVDAPCSGSGTWRRNPELKCRFGPSEVAGFARLQGEILRRFAPRVRPGGRLVYATCSLLAEENEEVVRGFLEEAPEFRPVRSRWAEAHLPPEALAGGWIRLDPLRTSTDGFFVAVMARKPGFS